MVGKMKNSVNHRMIRGLYIKRLNSFLIIIAMLFNVQSASAIGVGGASAESYIGERLSAEIPVFNVDRADALQVTLLSSSIAHLNGPSLSVSIDRSNSQLAIRISSDLAFNEPYVSFHLQFVDQQNVLSKEFTLLLNLAPDGHLSQSRLSTSDVRASDLPSSANSSANSSGTNSGNLDLMGPYDYAEEGSIPAKFGAVIDGQSLWRVARRINSAMGVSINQMMIALYEANPEAFSSQSVDSLQAGSYLNIPSYTQASSVSDSQAKQALDRLSSDRSIAQDGGQQSLSGASQESAIAPATLTESSAPDSEEVAGISASEDSFRLTGIDEQVQSGGTLTKDGDSSSQEIINSLASTVGNLTQELIQKDKKIEFLQERIATLEKLAMVDGNSGVAAGLNPNTDLSDQETAGLEVENQSSQSSESNQSWSWWYWLIPLLLMLGFVFRERLAALLRDLNLLVREREVDFGSEQIGDSKEAAVPVVAVDDSNQDYSILSAVTKAMEQEDEEGDIDFINMHALEDVTVQQNNKQEDSKHEGIDVDETNLDFEQRFERLLKEKDFDFALELLDFARHNDIDDDRYHCERLRLLQVMGNEVEFYNYYYDIESRIPSFALDVQSRISQLIVELARTKA